MESVNTRGLNLTECWTDASNTAAWQCLSKAQDSCSICLKQSKYDHGCISILLYIGELR